MSVKKLYMKKNGLCKVTFSLPKTSTHSAERIAIVGNFNEWNPQANPMDHLKNGTFKATVRLEKDNSYQFRYLIDGHQWENETEADETVPNFHGSHNSVVHI